MNDLNSAYFPHLRGRNTVHCFFNLEFKQIKLGIKLTLCHILIVQRAWYIYIYIYIYIVKGRKWRGE